MALLAFTKIVHLIIILQAVTYPALAQRTPRLNITIRTDNKDEFEVGTPRVLACIVVGCAPSLNVTWYLGDIMLRPNVYKEVNRGNFTVSSLTFVPSLTDNGKELVCRATNGYLSQVFEDRVTISVGQRPKCVDSSYKTIRAVVGESQTLVCVVESDPDPEQFVWSFPGGRTIYTSSKIVPGHKSRYSSALVWVPQTDDYGPVYCRALNRFGDQKQPCTFSVVNGVPSTPDCDFHWDSQEFNVPCSKKAVSTVTSTENTYLPYPDNSILEIHNPEDAPPIWVFKSSPRFIGEVVGVVVTVLILVFAFSCAYYHKSRCCNTEERLPGHYRNNIELGEIDSERHVCGPITGITSPRLSQHDTNRRTHTCTTRSLDDYEAPFHKHEYCI